MGYPYLMVKLKAFLNCHCSNSWDIMSAAGQVLLEGTEFVYKFICNSQIRFSPDTSHQSINWPNFGYRGGNI